MIKPSVRLLILGLIPLAFSVVFWGSPLVFVLDGSLVLLILTDFLLMLFLPKVRFEVTVPPLYSIGRKGTITITVSSERNREKIRGAWPKPEFLELENHRWVMELRKDIPGTHTITFCGSRRGEYLFPAVYFYRKSVLGLFWAPQKEKLDTSVKICPDVETLKTFYHLARSNKLNEMGFHKLNLAGSGMELHYLRGYHVDDDARHIDWKATKRLGRPVTKVFSAESSNQIIFVLDAGRLMTTESEGMSLFDYAVNGTLLLAHVALRMGDSVGIIAMADKILAELKPIRGGGSQKRIMSMLSSLSPKYTDTNYTELFHHLHRTVQKRSLLIFFNDFIDGNQQDVLLQHTRLLSRKHLLLFLMLRNTGVESWCRKETLDDEEDFFIRTAARDFHNQRYAVLQQLSRMNAQIADILPSEINTALVNKYLNLRIQNKL